ncbi:Lcl C-terminal domain-containing protein [Faucicola boevrei]|uniref:Lcl C-terminal domain-containing protein n=1 Tax=Faucicola boevrei TaxID=346665 RepID=UPI00037BBBEA|nr:DUF1566 domain-containing protein [Moraxella boevrei]
MPKIPFTSKLSVMTVSILLLSACGGGGSSHSANDVTPVAPTTPVTPTTPVPPAIATPQKSTLLTATGMTKCGNDLLNDLPCDKLSEDFKGLQQDGEVKAGTAMNYKLLNQNGGECVQDLATGLIWEQKTNDNSIHDVKHTYTWYSDDEKTNGGVAGKQNGGKCGLNEKCDTKAFIDSLNEQKYCGYSDWRLPETYELYSIMDFSKLPALNDAFKHTTTDKKYYWSSTLAGNPYENTDEDVIDYMYTVDFGEVFHFAQRKDRPQSIRAVRSSN